MSKNKLLFAVCGWLLGCAHYGPIGVISSIQTPNRGVACFSNGKPSLDDEVAVFQNVCNGRMIGHNYDASACRNIWTGDARIGTELSNNCFLLLSNADGVLTPKNILKVRSN